MKPTAPRIYMPESVNVGEIIKIKTKIRHPMETGWRKDGEGNTIERNRLTQFTCLFNGEEVVRADYSSGMSQDPYFLFHAKVLEAGTFTFRWVGDFDQRYEEHVTIGVTS